MGCYGESLIRKFGDAPPTEWIAGIATLDDVKLARGMRRVLFGGKTHPPSLPEFMRLCRLIADDDIDEPPSYRPLLDSDAGKFDEWDIAGNQHLLGYITRRFKENPRCWGAPYSRQQADATGMVVMAKNVWVQDAREGKGVDPATGELMPYSIEEQKAAWIDGMHQAEVAIARMLADAAA